MSAGHSVEEQAALGADQVAAYHDRGYIAVENVLTTAEVAELRAVTEEFVERSRQVTTHTEVFDLEPGHSPERPRLRRLKAPHHQHDVYDRVLRHRRILDIVAELIGARIRYRTTKRLMVVPGSHHGPVLDHHQDGYFAGAVTAPDGLLERAVPIELHAGGISVHHARLLHGSAPNTSTRPRRFLLAEYAAADAWPLVGSGDWDEFNSRLLRGDPVLEPRLEPVPVRIPLPTHARQGSIYEVQSVVRSRAFHPG
ncbi:phytanoyl-CoA dioxygenase family protein [Actinopolymorpha pittospori]|uniref:Ectoine hydroxylase-related dioxygenase (Phytanoyl-CoA dioxygenase family) n=1 Tax=Actinopolymorpha pittospori TaxID=648752 RepID=A0A927N1I5_9ACTN|nr:phytanoyl-CoA dioxygenase family protein [Actinopolymorpha pittospori]MBE1607227.1 ectoine hydroxylase-related dioxygenase (phytanoyl-CoA dioxygenase family) [Actinopolymorpha pittospori]